MKKVFLILASVFFINGCSSNNIREDKPVKTELYLIHSTMKSYEVIKEEDRRDWSPNLKIEDIIAELPKESNAQLIYKTEVESNWNDFTEVENFNFVSDAWEIKNKADIVKVLNNKPQDSSFKFKIKPLFFSDGRTIAEMRYSIKFLTSIENYVDEASGNKIYYPIYEVIQYSKSINFLPGRYYVFAVMPLKDKTSLILVYKLEN